jgi:hydrogenase large subunit
MKKSVTLSPLPRVEGDVQVHLDLEEGRVAEARVSGILFRGFEKLMVGREPMDALVFAPRICGICSIGQSTAAANLLRRFYGVDMPPNAYWMRNVVLGAEMIMNHQTHFYLLFGVDLADPVYRDRPGYAEAVERFTPMQGSSYTDVLLARKKILEIMGLFAGKWPNSLALQPGGVTRAISRSDLLRVRGVWKVVKQFVEDRVLNGSLERWLEVQSLKDLDAWLGEKGHEDGDLGLFFRIGRDFGLNELGKGPGRYLSCGSFEEPDGQMWMRAGYFNGQKVVSFSPDQITESVAYTWLTGDSRKGVPPLREETKSDIDKKQAYSWARAPRYGGATAETGPIARLVVDGDPLAKELNARWGSTVFTRVFLRMHDLIRVMQQMGVWLDRIDPEDPFYFQHHKKEEGEAMGSVEVSRGALTHWIRVSKGMIVNYQVISPSTWNFSPRDEQSVPGAVEQALAGAPAGDPDKLMEVVHIIRSFDPCLFCTVHSAGIRGRIHV